MKEFCIKIKIVTLSRIKQAPNYLNAYIKKGKREKSITFTIKAKKITYLKYMGKSQLSILVGDVNH